MLGDHRGEIPPLLTRYNERLARHGFEIADLMKTETLQDSLEVYRQKTAGKRRNISAAYELALKAERPYLSGDQISYYVTGRNARVKVNAAARMAADFNRNHPDENVEYYQSKLAELYAKFKPYVDRPGLFDPSEIEEKQPLQQELFAAPESELPMNTDEQE